MEASCRITLLALVLTIQLLISVNTHNMLSIVRRQTYGISAAAVASPLAGTKIRTPWLRPSSSRVQPGRRYIPSEFDVDRNQILTKLLDVGACNGAADAHENSFSYVPPLDGTIPNSDNVLCQQNYGMRFVLFDLQLVNIDTVDSLSGSFTAQFQLVFHWTEGWEANDTDKWFAYVGDDIETADDANLCGFDCDSTSASKTRCCDRMWVPPLQVPSCKVNDVQSVTPTPYLTTTYSGTGPSYWSDGIGKYTNYSTRRTWYVGLDVTCPFTPDFRNFPFDHQFLTLDIINPYASRTWLQLNKGFLEANIIDSIAGIDLSPLLDDKIDGWRIEDFTVSTASLTQQTWMPTFLTQDYLLQILGNQYESQEDTIMAGLGNITCAEMRNLISQKNISLSNPSNRQPYEDTMKAYMQRLDATVAQYKKCTSEYMVEFQWNTSIDKNKLVEVRQFNYSDGANVNRSFRFLDLEYPKAPSDGINFQCLIDAVANLTTPGIRINITIQRFKTYYFVKLFLPICACVAFTFTSFALGVHEIFNRLTVIVPSVIALSALQGFVVSTDIPVVAYIAPTTYVVLLSYATQLLIALECICFKMWRCEIHDYQSTLRQSNKPLRLPQCNEKANALDPRFNEGDETQEQSTKEQKGKPRFCGARKLDVLCCALLLVIYIILLALLVIIPLQHARRLEENNERNLGSYESLKYRRT